MNPQPSGVSRRKFLESGAENAAGVAAGMIGLAGSLAHGANSPGERIRLAVIGLRTQGKTLIEHLLAFPDVEIRTVCDIDANQFGPVMHVFSDRHTPEPQRETDFRKVLDDPQIDAVIIAAPDHWHALMTIMACQAGKDVYVESPLSQTFHEGTQMIAAAQNTQRIVQTGLPQRSGEHFRSAVELVQSGKLGTVRLAKAWVVHRRKNIGYKGEMAPPTGVDYDLWLGPAPERGFTLNRWHSNWQWFWDYGTGELGNWGVQLLDIARWGLNVELPERISASGGKYHFQDDQETPDTLMVSYNYPGRTIQWEHRLWSTHGIEGRSAAVAFYGENGTLIVDRGGWKVYDSREKLTSGTSEQQSTHLRNFLDCVRTRRKPNADVTIGHASSALCHLGNIAYRMQRELSFSPENQNFGKDLRANKLLTREYRSPWELPVV